MKTEDSADFWADLTIRWDLLGHDEWTEAVYGPDGKHQQHHSTPRFRYSVQWGENSMSFVVSYVEVESQDWDSEEGHWVTTTYRDLQASDIQGDEAAPSDWQGDLDIDELYSETLDEHRESGQQSGEIVPTWIDISKLILNRSS